MREERKDREGDGGEVRACHLVAVHLEGTPLTCGVFVPHHYRC